MNEIGLLLTVLSLIIWIILLCFRGQFWQADQKLEASTTELETLPSVCVVIPARNEAELLPTTLRSLFHQDYKGTFSIILVDDHSTDDTAMVAQKIAEDLNKTEQLNLISAQPLPPSWTGKLWAIEEGIQYSKTLTPQPDYFLLTDADIEHDPANLRQLITKAQQEDLDLVSLMVLLRCQSFWEKLLIPAFVFFFQKLYPFRWVNDPDNSTAAAAGGCILIHREALKRIGGISSICDDLIDDCALAKAVKYSNIDKGILSRLTSPIIQDKKAKIWLGLSSSNRSLRAYPSLSSIWKMVARTAFNQLNYSRSLLLVTFLGMTIIYIIPSFSVIFGLITENWLMTTTGLMAWILMAIAYYPTLRLYQSSPLLAFCLPAIAFFYTLMILDSAWRYWRGQGGAWKGRVYSPTTNSHS
ncbi:MAG: glycosyltransferase [Coleofasciculaceae cyanobacterium]